MTKTIYSVKPLKTFLSKNEVCDMTLNSGAFDKSVFNGNTTLLKVSEENDKHKYLYIGGDTICSFLSIDNVYKYISNTGNFLTPYSIAIGDENIFFLTPHFIFIKRRLINDNELLKSDENSVDPFDYHTLYCGVGLFRKLRIY